MGYAYHNGWEGIIINGYVRDTHQTTQIPVGLWALGTYPFKSQKKQHILSHAPYYLLRVPLKLYYLQKFLL
jgi:regulator of RNase E activity RraA